MKGKTKMLKRMEMGEMIQLKEESIQIENSIEDLYNRLDTFIKKYAKESVLGEEAKAGLTDYIIYQIEQEKLSLMKTQELFRSLTTLSDRTIDQIKNPIEESVVNSFKC